MSLIHLEKSVLSFHFKEILEDRCNAHPLALLGIGVLLFGPKLLGQQQARSAAKTTPSLHGQTGVPLTQWVAAAQKQELTKQLHTLVHPHAIGETQTAVQSTSPRH